MAALNLRFPALSITQEASEGFMLYPSACAIASPISCWRSCEADRTKMPNYGYCRMSTLR